MRMQMLKIRAAHIYYIVCFCTILHFLLFDPYCISGPTGATNQCLFGFFCESDPYCIASILPYCDCHVVLKPLTTRFANKYNGITTGNTPFSRINTVQFRAETHPNFRPRGPKPYFTGPGPFKTGQGRDYMYLGCVFFASNSQVEMVEIIGLDPNDSVFVIISESSFANHSGEHICEKHTQNQQPICFMKNVQMRIKFLRCFFEVQRSRGSQDCHISIYTPLDKS